VTTTLLALHGLGADRHQPLALIDQSAPSAVHVVAPDLRGHGGSSLDVLPGLLTIQQLAADTERLIGNADDALLVVGISMGAAVAVELLGRGTLPIRGLILIRPAWRWDPDPENLRVFPRIAELLRGLGPDAGRQRFRAGPDYERTAAVSPAAAEALLEQFSAPHAVARADRLAALPRSAPRRPTGALPPSAVVIGSPLDPVHPLHVAEELASDLGVALVIAPPRYDAPEEHRVAVAREIHRLTREA
jgi:pimeloyl-ACP methyl ester carboxylesterase